MNQKPFSVDIQALYLSPQQEQLINAIVCVFVAHLHLLELLSSLLLFLDLF